MKSKKKQRSPQTLLTIVLVVIGALYYVVLAFGYTLVPVNRGAPAVLSTIITAAVVLLTFKAIKQGAAASGKPATLSALMPFFAIFFVIGKAVGYDTDGIELYLLPVYAYIMLLCGLALFFACVKNKKTRVRLGVLYTVLIIPMLLVISLWDFGPKPVLISEMSPDSIHLAEAVDSDQGVFGRNAIVYVYEQGSDISLAIGSLRKLPKLVYMGEFEESETMTIIWESNESLLINGDRFDID